MQKFFAICQVVFFLADLRDNLNHGDAQRRPAALRMRQEAAVERAATEMLELLREVVGLYKHFGRYGMDGKIDHVWFEMAERLVDRLEDRPSKSGS